MSKSNPEPITVTKLRAFGAELEPLDEACTHYRGLGRAHWTIELIKHEDGWRGTASHVSGESITPQLGSSSPAAALRNLRGTLLNHYAALKALLEHSTHKKP